VFSGQLEGDRGQGEMSSFPVCNGSVMAFLRPRIWFWIEVRGHTSGRGWCRAAPPLPPLSCFSMGLAIKDQDWIFAEIDGLLGFSAGSLSKGSTWCGLLGRCCRSWSEMGPRNPFQSWCAARICLLESIPDSALAYRRTIGDRRAAALRPALFRSLVDIAS